MAVVENAGAELGRNTVGSAAANRSLEAAPPSHEPSNGGGRSPSPADDQDQPKQGRHRIDPPSLNNNNNAPILSPHDQSLYQKTAATAAQAAKIGAQNMPVGPGVQRSNGGDLQMNGDHHHNNHNHHNHHHHQHHHDPESFSRDMRELRELFSKLNPMAEEFVPPSLANNGGHGLNAAFGNNLVLLQGNSGNGGRNGNINGFAARRVLIPCLLRVNFEVEDLIFDVVRWIFVVCS